MSHSQSGQVGQPLLVVAGLIEHQGEWLVTQRPPGDWMEGYWEFPGGKLKPGEDPRLGLEREILEELAIHVRVGEIREVLLHHYPDRSVLLLFFYCQVMAGEPVGCIGQQIRWVTPAAMLEMPFLPADKPVVEQLASRTFSLDSGLV